MASLARPDQALSNVAWMPSRELPLDEWLEYGRRLGIVGRGVAWWIGDWVRYGNARYGERYARAARATGYDTQTLMNMVYVASRFEPSRRRQRLSWSHHAEVASMELGAQDHWLDLAEAERLSVRSLRLEVRAAKRARQQLTQSTADRQVGERDPEIVCPRCMEVIAISP